MSTDENWLREHRRKLVTITGAAPGPDRPEMERKIHGLLVWLISFHGDVDVSNWELAYIAKTDTATIETTIVELARQRSITLGPVEGPEGNPGIRECQCSCPMGCGHWITAIHRRVMEQELSAHLREAHRSHAGVDLTPPGRRGTEH